MSDEEKAPPRRGSAARAHPPMRRLSERAIEALPASPGADFVVMELSTPGFGVRVSWRGSAPRRAYFYGYRRRDTGESRRITLGAVGEVTVKQARAAAAKIAGEVAMGRDPSGERQAVRLERTVDEVGGAYLANVRLRRKPTTAAEYARMWAKHVSPAIGRKKITHVAAPDVRRLHSALSETPYQANRLLAMLGAFFTFAEKDGARPGLSNPAHDVEKYPEHARERFLIPAEVMRLGEALTRAEREGLPPAPELRRPAPTKRPQNRPKGADSPIPANPYAVAALRLLLLTCCREGEILSRRWDAVDLERGFLRLADTKTGKNVRPLGAAAAELLAAVPRLYRSPFVFPGLHPSAPLRDLKRLWYAVRHAAGLRELRLHDLRHSFASVSAIGGDSLLVTRALLGHRNVNTTQRYAHLSDDPVRAAVDRVSGELAAWMRGQETPVTPIRRGNP